MFQINFVTSPHFQQYPFPFQNLSQFTNRHLPLHQSFIGALTLQPLTNKPTFLGDDVEMAKWKCKNMWEDENE